ncbi:hypothetical protein [Flavobacterium sp. GCM10023249]|uniref:hypothetical protein n=1 Tax=unclassified Flavobacterium TaxID=196869 RepID=UPI0036070C45
MKNLFGITFISLMLLIVLVNFACQKQENHHSNTLLLEQSKELTIANKRELHHLLSSIWSINVREKKQTSIETQKIENLYTEFENFELKIQKSDRKKAIELINQQNAKFKNDSVYNIPGFIFKPIVIEELNELNDDVFKSYSISKISNFYLVSAGYIFTSRSYGREAL